MQDDLKLPPHNIQAEQSVLGGLLIDNDAFDSVHTLKASDFYQHDHALIYRAITALLQERKPVDIVTVAEVLNAKDELTQVGGIAYIGSLAQNTPTAANIKRYAEIVQEKALLRDLIAAANAIAGDCYTHGEASLKLDRAQSAIMRITELNATSEPKFVGDLLHERINEYDELFSGNIQVNGTGLSYLDANIGGGFKAGQMIVIAARPAMGKSALAVQLAEQMQSEKEAAIIFSCEMTNAQIVDRIIAAHSKVDSSKMQTGKFDNDDFDGIIATIPKIQAMNLLVDDRAFNLNSIASKARTVKRKHGLSVIVIDYLQLLEGVGDIREQQIASISRGIKKLAIELNVPIIALSQLNRDLEKRPDRRPRMSDIRESGAIEQDADIILAIYRDEEYNPDSTDKGTAEIIGLKNRSGKTFRIRTAFVGEQTRFFDFANQNFQSNVTNIKAAKGFSYE